MTADLFDVAATRLDNGVQRIMESAVSEKRAEFVVTMAVHRRGVETEFFAAYPHPHACKGKTK